MMRWNRRALIAAGWALAASTGGARAASPQTVSSDALHRDRLTVPVRIDGRGPFAFAIDSAANASVIAADLARSLALSPDGEVAMHTLIGREIVETVRARRLETGALDVAGARLALASRVGLDGLDGLVGADLLADLRLDLRFRGARRMRISRSRRTGDRFLDARPSSARLVRAVQQRFNGLMMIEAWAGSVPILAILDTGAQVSVANTALALAAHASPITLSDGGERGRVQSPTGRTAEARPMLLHGLRFGGLTMGRLPLLVGDFHTFDLWGVADRPALLMGVDVLGLFESVAIDLKRGEVIFEV